MADLMTGTYSFDTLKNKYGDFQIPLIKVLAKGCDLAADMKLSIVDMKVVLSLNHVGMAVLRIDGLYDAENHSFDKKVKQKFTLGEIMEIELGYLSASVNIFKGYVAMVGADFGDSQILVVTLMDVRRLMMVSGNTYAMHEVVNYSDVFRNIMGRYSKLCTPEIDDTDDHLEQPVSQTRNDYVFVTEDLIGAGKVNREFFVLADKVYFRKLRTSKQPVMTLEYGRELLTLRAWEEYQDIQAQVIGYDRNTQTVIEAKVPVSTDREQKKILSSTQSFIQVDPCADTQKKADIRAEATADKKRWQVCGGQGVTIGLPELVPGRFVRVESLEKDYGDHTYYITEVVHEITAEGFRTIFEIGGWI